MLPCICREPTDGHNNYLLPSCPIPTALIPVLAPQALRDWFEEETTGYLVTCQDAKGASVTKAQLREVARRA